MTANPLTWHVCACVYACSNRVVLTTLVCLGALCPQCRRVRRLKSSGAGEIVRAKGGREGQESDEGQGSLIKFSWWCIIPK